MKKNFVICVILFLVINISQIYSIHYLMGRFYTIKPLLGGAIFASAVFYIVYVIIGVICLITDSDEVIKEYCSYTANPMFRGLYYNIALYNIKRKYAKHWEEVENQRAENQKQREDAIRLKHFQKLLD